MKNWQAHAREKLIGNRVQLERLVPGHIPELELCFDASLFQFYTRGYRTALEFAQELLPGGSLAAEVIPYVVRDLRSGKLVGQTEYMAGHEYHRRVEIGGTWYAKAFQGGYVNPEAKLLMMSQAFEEWKCVRVEFKTDSLNLRSQAAIAKLGAKLEGVLRNHMICADGRRRHSVYFSITDEEWGDVRQSLEERLKRI